MFQGNVKYVGAYILNLRHSKDIKKGTKTTHFVKKLVIKKIFTSITHIIYIGRQTAIKKIDDRPIVFFAVCVMICRDTKINLKLIHVSTMNLKSLLTLPVVAIFPAMSFAANYYVTPDGAGAKDGSSWDNAFGVAEFRTQAENNANGDVYYFEGGLYNLSEKTVVFKVATGATLIGNADGERTVFSGDKNGNNNPDNGDAERLIRFQANTVNGNSANAIVIENIDFTGVYTNASSAEINMAALAIDNSGDVLVKGCRFYSNWAQGSQGGPAAYIYRSTVKFVDCMFYNNSANYRGGAIRINSNDVNKGFVTLENCVIKNNKNYHNYGGAIFMSHGNSLNIVNSTITGNSAVSDGGAIYFNGYDSSHHREVRIVNSTIAGNTTANEGDAQIVSTNNAHLSIANSIITSDDAVAAIMFKGDAAGSDFSFVSGGYNYVGSVIEPTDNEMEWAETDTHGDECSYSSIFEENKLNDHNVIVPAIFVPGADGEQVVNAVASWGLPAGLDLTVDQLGNERLAGVTPGAYAVDKNNVTTGVADIVNDGDKARLVKIAAGVYAVEGVEGGATVYNVSGVKVLTSTSDNIDLSASAPGLYIVKVSNSTFKVIR